MLERLRQFRKKSGLSKMAMANHLNISLSYYEKIETGQRNPSYNFISRFSLVFPESDIVSIFFGDKKHIPCDQNKKHPVYEGCQ